VDVIVIDRHSLLEEVSNDDTHGWRLVADNEVLMPCVASVGL
jgi:hypothetical protein